MPDVCLPGTVYFYKKHVMDILKLIKEKKNSLKLQFNLLLLSLVEDFLISTLPKQWFLS